MNPNNNAIPANNPADNSKGSTDQVLYRSDDGQFEVVMKVNSAWRKPAHKYPVICLRLKPRQATRIQQLRDGSGGLDVLLTHREVAAHLTALNQADPKGDYRFNEVPEKSSERKAYWDKINRDAQNNRQGTK